MFRDSGLKKLIPSKMEIESYTTDIVKIRGKCYFYLVHPDSKKLMKVMFFVVKENGSILLSCRTTMELGLIKPHAHLDYSPPKARLLTSTSDQPSKTKLYKPTIQCTKKEQILVQRLHHSRTQSVTHNYTEMQARPMINWLLKKNTLWQDFLMSFKE